MNRGDFSHRDGRRLSESRWKRASTRRRTGGPGQAVSTPAPRGAVERSLRLMEMLTEEAAPTSLPALASGAGLETNTAHRLLERLVATGYVRKCAVTKRYSIGGRALFPMSLHHPVNRLRLEVREQLRLLREQHDESVCLILFMGHQRVITDFLVGREPMSPLYQTWLGNPLHASAAGIVLLSACPDEQRRKLLGEEPFVAPTNFTVRTHQALEKELEALDEKGYAVVRQTTFVGINAIAAPIAGPHGPIGCLVISGSAHAMDDARIASLGESLRHSANLISWGAPSVKAVGDFLGDPALDSMLMQPFHGELSHR